VRDLRGGGVALGARKVYFVQCGGRRAAIVNRINQKLGHEWNSTRTGDRVAEETIARELMRKRVAIAQIGDIASLFHGQL
jgi:hypothetical protein